jgi:hypothetical protein
MTAVEWLRKELETIPNYSAFYTNNYTWIDSIMNEAKEMEKQQIIDFANWLDKLTPSQRTSVWSKNGEGKGLFNMDNEQLFEKFKKEI